MVETHKCELFATVRVKNDPNPLNLVEREVITLYYLFAKA